VICTQTPKILIASFIVKLKSKDTFRKYKFVEEVHKQCYRQKTLFYVVSMTPSSYLLEQKQKLY